MYVCCVSCRGEIECKFERMSINFVFLPFRIQTSSTQVTDCSTSSIATRVALRTTFSFMPWGNGESHRPFMTFASSQVLQ